jgi:hypothetical protein
MRLYHVSPSYNYDSIRSLGLRTACCRDARRSIWLVPRKMLSWAVAHVQDRHECKNVHVWVVDVPRGWTRRAPHGPYTIDRDVPPERIEGRLAVDCDRNTHV